MVKLPITFPLGGPKQLLKLSALGNHHLLEYTSGPDNRFNVEFIDAYLEALAFIRTQCDPGVLITTSAFPKFFSNGLDFEQAIATDGFFPDRYFRLMRAVMQFPWPTVAFINGHAFAAGFMIAACHDFRIMNPDRGFLCMNEVEFGAPLLAPFMSIFSVKFGNVIGQKIALTAHRFSGKEAFENKMVHKLGGMPETLEIADEMERFVKSSSYGAIRKEMLKQVITDTLRFTEDGELMAERADEEDEYYSAREVEIRKKLSKL